MKRRKNSGKKSTQKLWEYKEIDRENFPKVRKTLEFIVNGGDLSSNRAKMKQSKHKGKNGPLVKECDYIVNTLASHRFKETAKLLSVLSMNSKVPESVLYRASMLVLENLENTYSDDMKNVLFEVKNFLSVNKREIALELIILCLRKDIPNIQHSLEAFLSVKEQHKLRKNEVIDSLLKAYTGMAYYVDWYKVTQFHMPSAVSAESLAEEATNIFQKCLEQPGQWDIFVLKLVEMLLFYDKIEEAETVLVKYTEINSSHINAYIYLISFLNKFFPESRKVVKYLKILAKLCPSNERVLLLVQKYRHKGKKLKKCLDLLFMFLDYPSNANNVEAWTMLSDLLIHLKRHQPDVFEASWSIWDERSQIWLYMYFNTNNLSTLSEADKELITSKTLVLYILDKDHPYIENAVKRVHHISSALSSLIKQDDLSQ